MSHAALLVELGRGDLTGRKDVARGDRCVCGQQRVDSEWRLCTYAVRASFSLSKAIPDSSSVSLSQIKHTPSHTRYVSAKHMERPDTSFASSRFQAQQDAVTLLAGAKTQANPESCVSSRTRCV